jgi:hypothetical protein
LQPGDLQGLRLSPLESFVLSRVADASDLSELGGLTGLPPDRVEEIVERLKQVGALKEAPSHSGASPTPVPAAEHDDLAPESHEPQLDEGATEPDDPAPATLFQQELRGLPLDERVQRARVAHDSELSAWCHDANARVIAAVLENPRTGLTQARLIARHHRDGQGLELLAARSAFAADEVVRRELLRNPQLQAGLIRRLWGQRRLLDQWKWGASRETTEQARRTLRESLRARFAATGLAEERVEVIIKTEGRCLGVLQGIPVDSKTTALLCGRPYTSTMLIQNLARWSAAAPVLLAHLLKQPLVRRNPSLRSMLNAHPNAPKELH